MRTFFISFSVVITTTMAFMVPVATKQLHEATIRQCVMHDWPPHQAEAHLKFCQDYLAAN